VDGSRTTTDYVVGSHNRYERVNGATQVHDAADNLLDDGVYEYVYDAANQLDAIVDANGARTTLDRGPLGRLVGTTGPSGAQVLTYAGTRLVEWRPPRGRECLGATHPRTVWTVSCHIGWH
jgi:YD repeat-containing protein